MKQKATTEQQVKAILLVLEQIAPVWIETNDLIEMVIIAGQTIQRVKYNKNQTFWRIVELRQRYLNELANRGF